jgi:hypothetical protein
MRPDYPRKYFNDQRSRYVCLLLALTGSNLLFV